MKTRENKNKEMNKNISKIKLKSQRAITLIALVVTIVVLLILAGVSLNLVLGDSGIIAKAKEARDKYSEAAKNDQVQINELYNILVGKVDESEVENRIESGSESGPEVKKGRYEVDGNKYFDTLSEAISNAIDGSVIRMLEDTEETNRIDIDKNITIDTNGKNMTCANGIYINESNKVIFNGNGIIEGNAGSMSFIYVYGEMIAENITINSNALWSSISNTILNSNKFISNNCVIDGISGGGTTIINEGEYENLFISGTVIINDGNIGWLRFTERK